MPRMKPGYSGFGASGNQWLFYCRKCRRRFYETVVPKWERDFYCSHCHMRYEGQVYVSHVKECLASEIRLKRMMATGSLKEISQMEYLAPANVSGPSLDG